jgi:aspartyl/asparaginyl beta-hydroxylase (cupin superfamily)
VSTQPADLLLLARSGVEALNRGDPRKAREVFERIASGGRADASVYLGLAFACDGLRDYAAALAAVDKALLLEPGNLSALLYKADHLDRAGDTRSASLFYRAVVNGAPPPNQLPPELRSEVARAQMMCERYLGQFESFLLERMASQGQLELKSTARFRQSLDILFGKKKIYFQEPLNYFFPELPQIQFYDRAAVPWLAKIEAATADIRAELLDVMKQESVFTPYVESNPQLPRAEQDGMLNNPDWSAFYLWKAGEIVPENAARCPKTLAALEGIPATHIKNRSPSILFSQLRPGAHIPPHTGRINARLICHLPLLVPEKCRFRVGNDTREVVEGKAWAFDDTMEHEAWNDSDRTRVILIFEVWRPELSVEERSLVSSMFDAIDAHSGEKPAWSI